MQGRYGEFIEHYELFEHPFAENFRCTAGFCEDFHFTCKPLRACKAVVNVENMPVRNLYTVSRCFQHGDLIVRIRLTMQSMIKGT